MKFHYVAVCGLLVMLGGCVELQSDPMIKHFSAPGIPGDCNPSAKTDEAYLKAIDASRGAHVELDKAQRKQEVAEGRADALARQPKLKSGSDKQALVQARRTAQHEVDTAAQDVADKSTAAEDADKTIRTKYRASQIAHVCRALTETADSAKKYNAVASDLTDGEQYSGGARAIAALAGASFMVLEPRKADNIAAAALVGGGAQAWSSGLKPGQRAVIYQATSDRLSCVVNRGATMISFYPSELELMTAVDQARRDLSVDAQLIDLAKANPPANDPQAANRATYLQRAQAALTDLQTNTDAVARAFLARKLAPQRIYDAAGLIRKNAAAQLNGMAPDIGGVVDLIQKLPDGMKKTPPPAPTPPAPAAGAPGANFRTQNARLASPQEGTPTTERVRQIAAYLEAEDAELKALLINDDEARYTAIAQCAG